MLRCGLLDKIHFRKMSPLFDKCNCTRSASNRHSTRHPTPDTHTRVQADVHYNRAILLDKLGRFDESVAASGEACALRPEWAEAHYNMGQTYDDMGRLESAIVCYENACRLRYVVVKRPSSNKHTHDDEISSKIYNRDPVASSIPSIHLVLLALGLALGLALTPTLTIVLACADSDTHYRPRLRSRPLHMKAGLGGRAA